MDRVLRLEAGTAHAEIRPADGGRLGSVVVDGHELLVTEGETPMAWGAYPMAPWAGRIRHGRFSFGGRAYELPLGMPPDAIHGVAYDRPWRIDDATTISIELDERWPFRGRVTQRFELDEDGLEVALALEADEAMPATVGWHPWFRRVLEPGDAPVTLRFTPDEMLLRDAEWIPDGRRVPPPPGPWDDVFTGVHADPELEWPGRLRLALSSSCAWWVVYTLPEHALCVEPQSGPPDAVNLASVSPDLGPAIVTPGAPLTHTMRWRWTRLGG
jgi:galactose mutarotase-like enzyme